MFGKGRASALYNLRTLFGFYAPGEKEEKRRRTIFQREQMTVSPQQICQKGGKWNSCEVFPQRNESDTSGDGAKEKK